MDSIASQITSITIVYSAVYSGADQRKHQSSPLTGEFPAQMDSNAKNVSIWWRHHVIQAPGVIFSITYFSKEIPDVTYILTRLSLMTKYELEFWEQTSEKFKDHFLIKTRSEISQILICVSTVVLLWITFVL